MNMLKRRTGVLATVLLLLCASAGYAQTDSSTTPLPTYRIAVFAPLYLDSVFSDNNFRYKQGIPRFITPALDFVQGVQIAFDSMEVDKERLNVTIYDSKAYTENIPWLIQHQKLDSVNLIIGSVKDAEYRQLAEFALQKKVPFVSATYPNDGGVTANPYLVIVNSTLRAHCDALFSYLLQNHGTDKIILCRKKGSQEDMVANFIKQANEQDGKPLLEIQTLNLPDSVGPAMLTARLDSNRKNIIIGGSLDENFAGSLANSCFKIAATYPITLLGMPNWDGMAAFHKKDALKDFPVYFSSPYFNSKANTASKIVLNAYAKKYKTKPSDMAFKGYEAAVVFTQLLRKYPGNLISNLNSKTTGAICEYNFKPVVLKRDNQSGADYFENKHLYLIKLMNGVTSKAW